MTKQRRITVCREGWYYLLMLAVIFAMAMLREVNLLLILAGMLSGPILLGWRLVVVTLRGLQVQRKLPRGICAGDLLVVNLDVTNTRKKTASWAVVVEERVVREDQPGGDRPIRPRVFFSHVPAAQSRGRVYRGRIPQRGRYRLGPLKVSTRFPFGFFRGTVSFGLTDTLTVFPRLGRLTPGWIVRQHQAFEGTQRRRHRPSRVSGEFYGVREWQTGDSRRWIHWRSSARHGALVVRQFEQHRNPNVAVLVDLWQPDEPDAEDLQNVELAVSFAATVVADVCRRGGSDLLVGITGTEPQCTAGPVSVPLLEETMKRLAVAAASDEDRLPELLKLTLPRIETGTDVIIVSTRSVDLNGTHRFARLWDDPARRTISRQIRLVNTSDNDLASYFQPL